MWEIWVKSLQIILKKNFLYKGIILFFIKYFLIWIYFPFRKINEILIFKIVEKKNKKWPKLFMNIEETI